MKVVLSIALFLASVLSSISSEIQLVKGRSVTGEVSFVAWNRVKVRLIPAGLMNLNRNEIDESSYMKLIHEKQMGFVRSNGFVCIGIQAEEKPFVVLISAEDIDKMTGQTTNMVDINLQIREMPKTEITTNSLTDVLSGIAIRKADAQARKQTEDAIQATKENIEKDINKLLGAWQGNNSGRATFAWSENGNLMIGMMVQDNFTSGIMETGFHMDCWAVIKRLYDKWNFPGDVSILGLFPIKDKYGNNRITEVGNVKMTRSEFMKINKNNFQAQDLGNFGAWLFPD